MDVIEAQAADVPGTLAAAAWPVTPTGWSACGASSRRRARPTGVRSVSVGVDDVLPLPDLEELWAREVPRDDDGRHGTALRTDLGIAELQLSAYRGRPPPPARCSHG